MDSKPIILSDPTLKQIQFTPVKGRIPPVKEEPTPEVQAPAESVSLTAQPDIKEKPVKEKRELPKGKPPAPARIGEELIKLEKKTFVVDSGSLMMGGGNLPVAGNPQTLFIEDSGVMPDYNPKSMAELAQADKKAVEGSCMTLGDFNLTDPAALERLNQVLDEQLHLIKEAKIEPHPNFRIFNTMNPKTAPAGGQFAQTGINSIESAVKDGGIFTIESEQIGK